MRELINILLNDENVPNEGKMAIAHTLIDAVSVGEYPLGEDGLYLRATDTEDANLCDVELWYNRKDEDGNISVGNTGLSKEEIITKLYELHKNKEDEKGRNL